MNDEYPGNRPLIPYECIQCGTIIPLYSNGKEYAIAGCGGCGEAEQTFQAVPKPKRTQEHIDALPPTQNGR